MKKWTMYVGMFIVSLVCSIAHGETINTQMESVSVGPVISDNIIVSTTRESYLGEDLNGDGDTNDQIITYYDASLNQVVNTGLVTTNFRNLSVDGNIIAFITPETALGFDANNDGDQSDKILRYFDISNNNITTTNIPAMNATISSNIIAFNVHEFSAGADLNNDGDLNDIIINYYDINSGARVNLGLVGSITDESVSGNIIAFSDGNIKYYDISTGSAVDIGVMGATYISVSGSIITFAVKEFQINEDVNGDGDLYDDVILYYDIETGTVTNTGMLGFSPSIDGITIAYEVGEWLVNEDLNGDGEVSSYAEIHYYDIATGIDKNTEAMGYEPSISGDKIAFYTYEGEINQDLNNDGYIDSYIVRYFQVGPDYPADVGLTPNTINMQLKDPYASGYVEVAGYFASEIDLGSIKLTTAAGSINAVTGEPASSSNTRLSVTFGRAALQAITNPGDNEVTISGSLTDGKTFAGTTTIKIIN